MRLAFPSILTCALLVAIPAFALSPSMNDISLCRLEVAAQPRSPMVGSDIDLEFRLTNVSNKSFSIGHRAEDNAEYDYNVTVTRGDSTPVRRTPYYDRVRDKNGELLEVPAYGKTFAINVPPGESDVENVKLNELFDIDEPGAYIVTATRREAGTNGVIVSTPLEIDVQARR